MAKHAVVASVAHIEHLNGSMTKSQDQLQLAISADTAAAVSVQRFKAELDATKAQHVEAIDVVSHQQGQVAAATLHLADARKEAARTHLMRFQRSCGAFDADFEIYMAHRELISLLKAAVASRLAALEDIERRIGELAFSQEEAGRVLVDATSALEDSRQRLQHFSALAETAAEHSKAVELEVEASVAEVLAAEAGLGAAQRRLEEQKAPRLQALEALETRKAARDAAARALATVWQRRVQVVDDLRVAANRTRHGAGAVRSFEDAVAERTRELNATSVWLSVFVEGLQMGLREEEVLSAERLEARRRAKLEAQRRESRSGAATPRRTCGTWSCWRRSWPWRRRTRGGEPRTRRGTSARSRSGSSRPSSSLWWRARRRPTRTSTRPTRSCKSNWPSITMPKRCTMRRIPRTESEVS